MRSVIVWKELAVDFDACVLMSNELSGVAARSALAVTMLLGLCKAKLYRRFMMPELILNLILILLLCLPVPSLYWVELAYRFVSDILIWLLPVTVGATGTVSMSLVLVSSLGTSGPGTALLRQATLRVLDRLLVVGSYNWIPASGLDARFLFHGCTEIEGVLTPMHL